LKGYQVQQLPLLTCTVPSMLEKFSTLANPRWWRLDLAKGDLGRVARTWSSDLPLAGELPDPGSVDSNGGMLCSETFEIEAMFKLSRSCAPHRHRRNPDYPARPTQQVGRPQGFLQQGASPEGHHVQSAKQTRVPGHFPAPSIGIIYDELRCKPEKESTWAGPPHSPGVRPSPQPRILRGEVTRLTRASGVDKGTSR
jgi:hypothetical protein